MSNRFALGAAAIAIAGLLVALVGLGQIRSNDNRLAELSGDVEDLTQQVRPSKNFEPVRANAADIRHQPTDLPAPITRAEPQTVTVELEAIELDGQLADGTTYTYWTFNGTVPGPFIRVREGDTVVLTLKNHESSVNVHSIDLHAVTGPGGGAASTQVPVGESKGFSFKALNPGLFVYHCASPHLPTHIAQGMYGLILVEPAGGLVPVDREFYLMQGEIYAAGRHFDKGHQPYNGDLLFNEAPNYVVFNGAFQALTSDMKMTAQVGERIRLYVGNAGPNLVSSLHVIGEIFDVVHREAGSEIDRNIQTTIVPAGGATIVEFTVDVPGRYQVVDHSISRAIDKGAVAFIDVTGDLNEEIFHDPAGHPMPGQGGH